MQGSATTAATNTPTRRWAVGRRGNGPGAAALALVAAASAAALLAALALQFLGGYRPCNLCVLERYPYLVAALAGAAGLWLGRPRPALALAALALAANVGLSAYHVGVEEGWLALPAGCAAAAAGAAAATVEDLRVQLAAAPARCDQAALHLLGLSLAAWNGLLAAGLLALALLGLARGRRRGPPPPAALSS